MRFWNADGSAGPALKGHAGDITSLSWHPDGERVASGDNKTVRLWNADGTAATPAVLTGDIKPPAGARAPLAWSPDGERLVTAGGNTTLLLSWQSDGTLAAVNKRQQTLRAVAWRPASRAVVTVDEDFDIRCWGDDGNPGPFLRGGRPPLARARLDSWWRVHCLFRRQSNDDVERAGNAGMDVPAACHVRDAGLERANPSPGGRRTQWDQHHRG